MTRSFNWETSFPLNFPPNLARNLSRNLSHNLLLKQFKLIERLENTQHERDVVMAEADFYTREKNRIDEAIKNVAANQAELEEAYRRWEELEA